MRGRLQKDDIVGRRVRAVRILGAAGELIERWGFDKTTVDDIARAAGVAKGTIYLHWSTRDALFVALLRQERLTMLTDVRERLAADVSTPIARTLFRHLAAAMLQRPLLKAAIVNDQAVLGRLAGQRPHPGDVAQRAGFAEYLELLREHRAIRPDLPLRAQVNVVSATFMGSLVTAPLMPKEYALTDDECADLIAETLHRTLGTDRPLGKRAEAALIRATTGYVETTEAIARRQFDASIGVGDSDGGSDRDGGKEDAR